MASSAYEIANLRQRELLRRSAAVLGGFSAENDITSVTYATGTDVPEFITYSNSTGTATRNIVGIYGELGLRSDEQFAIDQNRIAANQINQNNALLSGLGNSNNSRNNSFIRYDTPGGSSDGSRLAEELTQYGRDGLRRGLNDALQNSGLEKGAEVLSQIAPNLYASIVSRFPSAGSDTRVKISDPSGRISRLGGALEPLRRTDYKVVFPYTPEITINHQANYQDSSPTHSNYEYLFYQNSTTSEISINATFTARNADDAEYVLAVQHFFRSATKMFYGNDDIAGLPPIVCRLEGHGDLQFSYVPVVITGFNVTLPSDVDYISAVNTRSNVGRVPTIQTMSITAKPIYSRSRITNEFSLTDFARGNLLGDPKTGRGGFI